MFPPNLQYPLTVKPPTSKGLETLRNTAVGVLHLGDLGIRPPPPLSGGGGSGWVRYKEDVQAGGGCPLKPYRGVRTTTPTGAHRAPQALSGPAGGTRGCRTAATAGPGSSPPTPSSPRRAKAQAQAGWRRPPGRHDTPTLRHKGRWAGVVRPPPPPAQEPPPPIFTVARSV